MKKIMLLTILLFTYGYTQKSIENPAFTEDDFLIIAHRGASAYAVSHTLTAYEMAVQMRADYIEIDLQMTKDGKLVALHDSVVTFNNAQQTVADVTFDELQLYSPGNGYTLPNFDNFRIVDLAEILRHFGDSVNYYIEMKSPELYPGMEEELLKQLRENHLLNRDDAIPKVIIQSFNSKSLEEVFTMEPSIPLFKLYKFGKEAKLSKKELRRLSRYASGVGVNVDAINHKFIKSIHHDGLLVHSYTINDEKTMRSLKKLGVNGIITDRPDVAFRVRNENNRIDN
jgi:glycerophosphoryl diester phosphodiesterase